MKMTNFDFAKQLTENVCFAHAWEFDWDGIAPLIEVAMLDKEITPDHLAGVVSIKKTADVVIEWETNTETNYHEEMRKMKMENYSCQKVYTIQTDEGDRGWIQWIDEECREHDEINENSAEVNPDYFHIYRVISKEEYEIIRNLWMMYNETANEAYHEMLEEMIELTLEKNAEFKF